MNSWQLRVQVPSKVKYFTRINTGNPYNHHLRQYYDPHFTAEEMRVSGGCVHACSVVSDSAMLRELWKLAQLASDGSVSELEQSTYRANVLLNQESCRGNMYDESFKRIYLLCRFILFCPLFWKWYRYINTILKFFIINANILHSFAI